MGDRQQLEDFYIIKDGKKMQYGYTTGSCATAAAKAAAIMLFSRNILDHVQLMTPKQIPLNLEVEDMERTEDYVSCAIRKYAGDDPDVTDGLLVYAKVRKTETRGITILGGKGVGKVTKRGLEQPVGQWAINRVPRQMIEKELRKVSEEYGSENGLEVEISVPRGEEIAKKTFNPRLGIVGGISILGTSGIVVPMSEEALLKSIEIEMVQQMENFGDYLLITPGNYGETYLKDHMTLDFHRNIKCSNYVGKTIDMAVNHGAKGILFVAHIGKFIKVAGGIMDTHSRSADSRMEILAACAVRAGADLEDVRKILEAPTTDEGLDILEKRDILGKTMECVMEKISFYLNHRSCGQLETGAVIFSNAHGYLGETKNARALIEKLQ